MASIDRTKTGWRARWRTPEGASRSKSFSRKADAERFLTRIEASKLDANYVDPAAGRVTFGAFAESWLAAQTFDPSTHEAVTSRLRGHLLPTFGKVEIRHIRPSTVQGWLRGRQEHAAAPVRAGHAGQPVGHPWRRCRGWTDRSQPLRVEVGSGAGRRA